MLSCHALDNTPVLPITDKYVSKPPTRDITSTAFKQDTPPTGIAPSAPRGIIQYDPPLLSTRENNSTEITCVHSDDSITVPSTPTTRPWAGQYSVTDSYIWGTRRNNYGECSIVTTLSMITLMNYHLILSPIVTTLSMIILMNYPSLILWTVNGEQLRGKLGNDYGESYLISSLITLGHQHVRSLGNVT